MKLPQTNYGLGFSPLSMSNKSNGFEEELVANKEVGLMGILAGSAKNIISHERVLRSKLFYQDFFSQSIKNGLTGNVYRINLDNTGFATVIKNANTNLVAGSSLSVSAGTSTTHKIAFCLDLDIFNKSNSKSSNFTDYNVSITLSLKVGSNTKSVTITEKGAYLNNKIFELAHPELGSGQCTISITNITIAPGSTYSYSDYGMAIYDILFTVMGVI